MRLAKGANKTVDTIAIMSQLVPIQGMRGGPRLLERQNGSVLRLQFEIPENLRTFDRKLASRSPGAHHLLGRSGGWIDERRKISRDRCPGIQGGLPFGGGTAFNHA